MTLDEPGGPVTMPGMKNPNAVALGRLGGSAGTGAAKARPAAVARAAALARWAKHKKRVKAGARPAPENGA